MSTFPVAIHHSSELMPHDGGVGFQKFIHQAMQAPFLSADEEWELANRYQEKNDIDAAHRLVHSYLRLVLKISREYLNYKLNLPDLVQEGTVGLMLAVKKFDPKRGSRLATYAIWWIRASIHDFILRSWRLVKIATSQLKRKLFFKLRQAKKSASPLNWEEAEELAIQFGTDAETILDVDGRMSGADASLNQPTLNHQGDAMAGEMIDMIPDQRPNQEYEMLSSQKKDRMHTLIQNGIDQLNPREQFIISERFLSEESTTLNVLAQHLTISRERVRQIEKRALEKLRAFFQTVSDGGDLLFEG